MDTALSVGDRVLVRTFSGAVTERIVVAQTDEGPLVATPDEFRAAAQANRPALGVGWPAEFIVKRIEGAAAT
jgi:hypothetical protein